MVFFLVLAFGAKRRLFNVRELIAVGAVLVISAAVMIYPICVKIMIETIGYSPKAYMWAAAPVLTFVVALVWALRIMVQRMDGEPSQAVPQKKRVSSATRGKNEPKPAVSAEPHPKPQRGFKGKRRY